MKQISLKAMFFCFILGTISLIAQPTLSLQGVMDLYGSSNDLYSGTDGKAIHLVATADIADLSLYGLGIPNNGGGTDGVEFTFPEMSVAAGDDILVYRVGNGPSSGLFFSDYFGSCYSEFEHTIETGSWMGQNGDDPAELFENGVQIEAFGDVDGSAMSGDPYEDSWAYKLVDGTWEFGGEDCDEDDGTYDVVSSGCPYPMCGSGDTTGDVSGCMDDTAINYNVDATEDDGSCEYECICAEVYDPVCADGVVYSNACEAECAGVVNYVSGDCVVTGCMDDTANNFNVDATEDDGSCTYDEPLTNALSLQGVMDFTVPSGSSDGKAIHLVANADIADLSIFGIGVANNGGGTDGMEEQLPVTSVSAGDDILLVRSGDAMSAYFADCYGEFERVFTAGSALSQNGDDAIELFEGETVIETFGDIDTDGTGQPWEYMDSWAYKVNDGWTYGAVNCTDDSETSATSNCPYPLCGIAVAGCMDETAYNYNPQATSDDGSCEPVVEGCTWENADNYNPDANTNDGSCFTTYLGCTDSLALNFDAGANTEDGSCIYDNSSLTNALSLQGVLDLSLSSSDGKAIHLVATADITDLSVFGLGVANNGGGTDGMEYALDSVSASAGDDILILRSVEAMSAYFADCYNEFEHVLVGNTDISQNGDDAIELYEQGVVIETFGDIDVAGTGEVWEYMDSWAYKVDGEWTYGGVNCTDGSSTFSESECPYPICGGVTVLGCMDDGSLEYDYDGDGLPAFNYNPNATEENGTCITVIYGCTLQGADNYEPSANTNDGSCTFEEVALSLQGIIDFTVPSGGSDGKAIHLVASQDIADLSVYGIGVANNGGGTDGLEYTLDSISVSSGDDILVVRSIEAMQAYFADCYIEFEHVLVGNSDISQNGDDAIELFADSLLIETFGDIDVDGSGEAWEYMDSWAYKVDGEWTYGGVNCTDDSETSADSGCPYPICSYAPVGCAAPADWDVIITGSNHTILITPSAVVTLADGNVLDHANVGVFYTNANGDLACAGSTEITPDETVQIAAMGDDTTTDEIDGLQAGEPLVWMIADCYGNVFAANATYVVGGDAVFTINGFTQVSSITEAPAGPSEQELSFPTGWSMFSTYMIPADLDLANLLSPIVEQVIIAKDYLGAAYLPEWNFNGIGDLTLGQGYQIKTTETTSITVTGDYVMPQDHPIDLSAGWNMIGYLRIDAAAADAVLADINATGNLIIAKDYLGAAYLPEWNFNGIGDLNPGQAYQIKVNNADVLQYLSNDDSYRMSATEVTENNVSYYSKVAATDNNMTVVIEDAAWDVLPAEGAEIAAFDKDGNMVGSAIYSSPVTVVTVWGDDVTSTSKDGMLVSESVSFKVWNTNEVLDFTVSKWIEGSSSYLVDGISVASTIETNNVITELNASERVLVKVINVLGQEVNMDDEPFKGTVLFNVYDDGSVEQFVR